ncbi:MAG: CocE/NonD family hydrolase [Pseudomonadota bacterium]
MREHSPIRDLETIWITMPDKRRLAGRIWMPANAEDEPVPAIFEFIPYRLRDRTRLRDESMHPRFAARGYASVRVDIGGSGDSDGLLEDEYLQQELQDACDIIAWIADQPWCSGLVGMMGKSWGAYNSFQVAALQPPALKAIIPVMGTDDRWAECIHFNGAALLNDNFWWGSIMHLYNALPPDPEVVGENKWKELWQDRLEGAEFWPERWLRHQTRDAFWRHGSICEDYSKIKVPVYFMGGWADLYRDTPFRIAEHLKGPCKVLMGPWAHLYPHEGVPGPAVDFIDEATRWWDFWLKGLDTGIMDEPRLRFWLQDWSEPASWYAERPGRWVEESTWPTPKVSSRRFWLNEEVLADEPAKSADALSVCSPQDQGKAAGDFVSFACHGDQPIDQRLDEGGALTFRSAAFDHRVDILGQPSIDLVVSADQDQALVAAVLVDEAPSGGQCVITRGFFNLSHRNGSEKVTPVNPGQEMAVRLQFHGIGWHLAPGHRLVLHLSSTYWPILFPSPKPVTLTLRPGTSQISVPVRDRSAVDPVPRTLASPPPSPPRPITALRDGSVERDVTIDLIEGTVIHRQHLDGGRYGAPGRVRLDDIDTEVSYVMDRIYSIQPDDPLSAVLTMKQVHEISRQESWQATVISNAQMTATEDDFVLEASLECRDGSEVFFERQWSSRIPRNGM